MTFIILVLTLVLGSIKPGAVPNAPSGGNPVPQPGPQSVSDDVNVNP